MKSMKNLTIFHFKFDNLNDLVFKKDKFFWGVGWVLCYNYM